MPEHSSCIQQLMRHVLVKMLYTMTKACSPTGLICTDCQPHQVVSDAIEDARALCLREYGDAPDVNVYGDPGFAFAYVPSHLHHMVSCSLALAICLVSVACRVVHAMLDCWL
jgi:hypothetical protein